VVALDARSGRVLWRDEHEGVAAIAARRGQVVVAGFETPAIGGPRFFGRMLDADSGRLRWGDADELGSTLGAFATAVAFARDHVVVGGWVNRTDPAYEGDSYDDPLLLAYDAESGRRRWEKEAYLANDERVQRVLTQGGHLFALIDVKGSWRLEAREVQSGEAVWHSDLLLLDSGIGGLLMAGNALYLASDPYEHPATLVVGGIRAHDGAVGWTTKSQVDATYYSASALAADDERLYVVGGASDAAGGPRQAIWAYALR
jgi:outer membrane protein assembly factor BamB